MTIGKGSVLLDDLTIGPASEEEMADICQIAKVAWEPIHESMIDDVGRELHDVLAPDWKENKARQVRRQYETNPEWVLAVRDGNTVAGFVTFAIKADVSVGEIQNNAVAVPYQGRGIATAMYRHVLDLFREEGLTFAAVATGLDEGHAPARKAYERVGFNLRRASVTYYQELS